MPLLKAPSKQPKTTTLQVRLEEEVRHNLDRYAEFIGANPSYVVSEALKLFSSGTTSSSVGRANIRQHNQEQTKETHLPRLRNKHEVSFNPIRCAREYSVLTTACPAPCIAIGRGSIGDNLQQQRGMTYRPNRPHCRKDLQRPRIIPRKPRPQGERNGVTTIF